MKVRLMCCVLAGAVVLTGCSSSPSSGENIKSYDQAAKEYRKATGDLKLPKDAKGWPELPKEQDGAKVSYENEAARVQAEAHWLCEWEKEWLAQRGKDQSRETEALSTLQKYPSMVSFTKLDKVGRDLFNEDVSKAKLGDPSGFQQFVKANCG